jgi:hypothetical protein
MMRKGGLIVENTHEQFGLDMKCYFIQLDKLLFVDEVGSYTSKTRDGNIEGHKLLCDKEQWPQQQSATRIQYFTVLVFASTNDLPLCVQSP